MRKSREGERVESGKRRGEVRRERKERCRNKGSRRSQDKDIVPLP